MYLTPRPARETKNCHGRTVKRKSSKIFMVPPKTAVFLRWTELVLVARTHHRCLWDCHRIG